MKNARNWIIVALLAALPLAVLGGALAQQQRSTTVDVRVWQSVASPEQYYLSIRSGGGSWSEAGTIPLTLGSISRSGDHRYGDLSVTLSAPAPTPTPSPTATPTAAPAAAPSGGGPGDGGSGGSGGPDGGETTPTRTLAIESTPESTATAAPDASATPTPDTALGALRAAVRLAEAALVGAERTHADALAAFQRADTAFVEAQEAALNAYRARVAELQAERDAAARDRAVAAAYDEYLAAQLADQRAATAAKEALLAAAGAVETARANLRQARNALQAHLDGDG